MKIFSTIKCVFIFCIALLACKPVRQAAGSPHPSATVPYYPLRDDADLDILLKEIGDAKVVLLGESTHGTHEFYEWRAAITKKLIEQKGFDFVAVEGDWTDSYKVDQYIKGSQKDSAAAIELLKQYDRWPSSMWGNYEMASFVQWLNAYNQSAPENKIGFYGLDVYSFWEWTKYFHSPDTAVEKAIQKVKKTFESFSDDALKYSSSVRQYGYNYGSVTADLWKIIQQSIHGEPKTENEFLIEQQGLLAVDGEKYFRTMITDKVASWNIRDGHMAETVKRLLKFHGKNSKAVIWVHNGHAGDAHYSQMGQAGYTSVGEILLRELGRDKIFSAGFGTDKGAVTAGKKWNASLQTVPVPPALKGSWENILHEWDAKNKIVLSKDIANDPAFNRWISFRSIGAAYDNNAVYGQAIVPKRFDAFVFIDSTTASHPIGN